MHSTYMHSTYLVHVVYAEKEAHLFFEGPAAYHRQPHDKVVERYTSRLVAVQSVEQAICIGGREVGTLVCTCMHVTEGRRGRYHRQARLEYSYIHEKLLRMHTHGRRARINI